jgi:hypothetical protein
MSLSPEAPKVAQYSYFWISSDVVTAAEITGLVGIDPDVISIRGSRRSQPTMVPVEHSWAVECRDPAGIDEQVAGVLERVRPAAHAIRSLTDRDDVHAGLMLVRYFGEVAGEDAWGWVLNPSQIALLAEMGAEIQADEYLDTSTS